VSQLIQALDTIDLGERAYSPLTGIAKFLVLMFVSVLVLLIAAYYSSGAIRWTLCVIALIPSWFIYANLKNRLRGIWHRHYYPLMYLWAGASGVVQGQVARGIFKIDSPFNNSARLLLGLAFPQATDENARSLIELAWDPILFYYVNFGAVNSEVRSDSSKLLAFGEFCLEREKANPDLYRRVKLFALIIYKQVGREAAARYLANWGALV
jgi:hypothetical protein